MQKRRNSQSTTSSTKPGIPITHVLGDSVWRYFIPIEPYFNDPKAVYQYQRRPTPEGGKKSFKVPSTSTTTPHTHMD